MKNAPTNKAVTGRDNIRLYVIIAAALIAIALLSTFLADFSSRPGPCSEPFGHQNYNCLAQIAYNTSNTTMCGSIPTYYSGSCYTAIAEKTDNQTLCTKTSDNLQSALCTTYIANKTDSPSLCSKLNASFMTGCIDALAVSRGMPGLCVQISNSSSKNICLTAIYFSKAIGSSNASYCSDIVSNNDSNVTFGGLRLSGGTGLKYVNITQMLTYASFGHAYIGARDACYLSMAYELSNNTYCGYVSNNMTSVCNFTATRTSTMQNNTAQNVNQLNYTAFMNVCIKQESYSQCSSVVNYIQSISTNNVSSCASLSGFYANQCYYSIAERYNNTKYCSYIQNATLNGQCILSITTGYSKNQTNKSIG